VTNLTYIWMINILDPIKIFHFMVLLNPSSDIVN